MSLFSALCLTGALACACLGAVQARSGWAVQRQTRSYLRACRPALPPLRQRLEAWCAATPPGRALAGALDRAGVAASPLRFVLALAGAAVAAFVLVRGFLGIGGPGAVALALGATAALTRVWLQRRCHQLRARLHGQLPEVALLIGNALRAGHSLNQALMAVAEQAPVPAREIFRRCRDEVAVGRPLEDVLGDLSRRYDSPDLRLLVAAMLVQKQAGGNLIAALAGIARTLRHRQETLGEVRATLARAHQTLRILPALPFLCGLMLNVALPGFLAPLFTPPGLILLAAVIGAEWCALAVLRRVVRMEV